MFFQRPVMSSVSVSPSLPTGEGGVFQRPVMSSVPFSLSVTAAMGEGDVCRRPVLPVSSPSAPPTANYSFTYMASCHSVIAPVTPLDVYDDFASINAFTPACAPGLMDYDTCALPDSTSLSLFLG